MWNRSLVLGLSRGLSGLGSPQGLGLRCLGLRALELWVFLLCHASIAFISSNRGRSGA